MFRRVCLGFSQRFELWQMDWEKQLADDISLQSDDVICICDDDKNTHV